MIVYYVDTNAILYHPMKGFSETEIVNAYMTIQKQLEKNCFKPKLHHFNNEAPKGPKQFIVEVDGKYYPTPPNIHKVNAPEQAMF